MEVWKRPAICTDSMKLNGAAASNRGLAAKLTTSLLEENAAPASNQRKYSLSAITADKHLSSRLVNALLSSQAPH